MQFPITPKSATGDVQDLQDRLNRFGALLTADGAFGPATTRALHAACGRLAVPVADVVDADLWGRLDSWPSPCHQLPTQGVTFIAQQEVTSTDLYAKSYSHPTWPSPSSGMTIGVGYDLRFAKSADMIRDWRPHLADADYLPLLDWLGRVGSQDGVAALAGTCQSFDAAWAVFCSQTIPNTVAQTATAFPGYDGLKPLAQSALVSLVYNRGTSLDGPTRTEMQAIHDLIAAGTYVAVPAQFRSMKRLWPDLPGLQQRREDEARLWEQDYPPARPVT